MITVSIPFLFFFIFLWPLIQSTYMCIKGRMVRIAEITAVKYNTLEEIPPSMEM